MMEGSAFTHQSELHPHQVPVNLASHTIREYFGATVQLVADALNGIGSPATWREIALYLQRKQVKIDQSTLRASLLVLLTHSIVSIKPNKGVTYYVYHVDRARWMARYSRYLEYVKKAIDPVTALVVETLLLQGRLRTVHLITQTLQSQTIPVSDRYTPRQTVVEAVWKLVTTGFLQAAPPIDEKEDEEREIEDEEPKKKKVKLEIPDSYHCATDDDPAVVNLIQSNLHYKTSLPLETVWRVNITMLHDQLQAYALGRLVSDMYGHIVQSAGSLVTAALRVKAYQIHVDAPFHEATVFASQDILKYLPKAVVQILEKKAGGVNLNLTKAWKELVELDSPRVVRRVADDRYEIATHSLLQYLRDRIAHQVIQDRYGEVAARIVRVLSTNGWLESDTIAAHAMVPAKETREHLHRLFRADYVDLFPLNTSRQYNPSNAVYLWCVRRDRLLQKVTDHTMQATWNLRVRRQHETQVGNLYLERAMAEENEHMTDAQSKKKFELGLERLDVALLQLDDTLMALKDFT